MYSWNEELFLFTLFCVTSLPPFEKIPDSHNCIFCNKGTIQKALQLISQKARHCLSVFVKRGAFLFTLFLCNFSSSYWEDSRLTQLHFFVLRGQYRRLSSLQLISQSAHHCLSVLIKRGAFFIYVTPLGAARAKFWTNVPTFKKHFLILLRGRPSAGSY